MPKYKNIYIEITNECNLSCYFCPKTTRKFKELTADEFEHIILKTKHRTEFYYLHVMGEPLLNNSILDILKTADKHSIKIKLVTNGTLLNRYYKNLAEFSSIKKITVSLSCLTGFSLTDAENYLTEVLPCISYLLDNTNISITLRAWQEGSSNLQNLICKKVIQHLNEDFSGETINNLAYKNKLQFEKDMQFTWPVNAKETSGNKNCLALKKQIAILSNGNIVPCCLDNDGQILLGNIFKSSLEEIESSDLYNHIKGSFTRNTAASDLCKKCTFKRNSNSNPTP